MPTPDRGFQLTPLGERLYAFKKWAPGETRDSVLALGAHPGATARGDATQSGETEVLPGGGVG